jgi:molybdopterin/thiamine biosynthesis adenylyltransferase
MKPKLAECVFIYRKGDEVYLDDYNRKERYVYKYNENLHALLVSLDGKTPIEEFKKQFGDEGYRVIEALEREQLVYDASMDQEIPLDWKRRYSRLLAFFMNRSDQIKAKDYLARMRSACVTIIGLGGTGTRIATELAMSGVGILRLVDPDRVELSNLDRQLLFTEQDIGDDKVSAAKKRLKALSSTLRIQTFKCRIGADITTLENLIIDSNVVVNCADEPSVDITSDWVAKACEALEIPHIVGGGYSTHYSSLGPTIIPGKTALWASFDELLTNPARHQLEQLELPHHKPLNGALGPMVGIVASIQALEAIKIITEYENVSLANRLGDFDFSTLSFNWRTLES